MAKPTFYIVAGPNGSGKTTFALNDPALKSIPFINADIEAQRLSPGSPAKAALEAGRITLSNIAGEISGGREFALETTLSGSSTLGAIRRALAAGYAIDFSYICLRSPSLNVGRVFMRVAAGGHHVPEEDVLRRYSRSLANLPDAVALSDRARVFDNTSDGEPRPIFERREGTIVLLRQELPTWFRTAFGMGSTVSDPARYIEERLQALKAGHP
jgi:predicted ABC-type ATPase